MNLPTSNAPSSLLLMGCVGRPHGVKGELGVDWQGEYVPKKHDSVMLKKSGGIPVLFYVRESRWHKGRLLLSLEGITDRTAAQNLTGADVFMAKESLPKLENGEAFLAELPGGRVFLANGDYLGIIEHLEFPAGHVVWAIRDAQDHEILFPAEPCFIKSLDADRHEAVIDPPEGLLDIYRA